MSNPKPPLAVIRDYIERSTQWQEGGATRHDALKLALPELEDSIDWTEKGLAEWRSMWQASSRNNTALAAQLKIAISHLHAILNQPRTHNEQQAADTAARDWLTSIGSEPT